MPQLQPVTLTDRATPTPVDHLFTPEQIVGNVGSVIESAGVPLGNKRLTVSTKRASQSGKYKSELRLTIPVVQDETVNGVVRPTVTRVAYANVDFTFDPASSEQERNDVVGMLRSALSTTSTLVNDAVVKLQGVY